MTARTPTPAQTHTPDPNPRTRDAGDTVVYLRRRESRVGAWSGEPRAGA